MSLEYFYPLTVFIENNAPIFNGISWFILVMGALQNLLYFLQLPTAWLELREHSQAEDTESNWQMLISDTTLPISVLVPAYNEEIGIVECVGSMLGLEYPDVEIIIINDGSTDATLQRLIESFSLIPITRAHQLSVPHAEVRGLYSSALHTHLLLIDKQNGGKADAINAGINFSRCPLFCVVDADSILEAASLLSVVRPFMEDPQRVIAVGGTIRIINGNELRANQVHKVKLPRKFLPLVQTMEYLRAFMMARIAFSRWGIVTIISGAFGIFRRDIAIEVGGYSHNTVGEDLEILLKMHRLMKDRKQDYSIRYVPEPVCWTEAPESLAILGNQRKRWARGALEAFFKHRDMLFNPRYGTIGMIGFPLSLLIDVLGPISAVVTYIFIALFSLAGVLTIHFFLAFIALEIVLGIFISVLSLTLEEMELRRVPRASDLVTLLLMAIIENLGYRQLNNFWRVIGLCQFICKKQGWGIMKRIGFLSSK